METRISTATFYSCRLLLLVFYLIGPCFTSAPMDLPSGCSVPPSPATNSPNRVFIDSCCYDNPLLTNTWNTSDEDGDGVTWTDTSGEGTCRNAVQVCAQNNSSSHNNWLFTQYINTTLSNGQRYPNTMLPVEIDITFDSNCTRGSGSNCSPMLTLYSYLTNTEDIAGRTNTANYVRVVTLTTSGIMTVMVSNVSGGVYLALRDMGTCVTVNQISIRLSVCNHESVNNITFPESYASSTSVTGTCTFDNSVPIVNLMGTCNEDGNWSTTSSCICRAGFDSATNCSGCLDNHYMNGSACISCPTGSTSNGGTTMSCSCAPGRTTMNEMDVTTSDPCVCTTDHFLDTRSNTCVMCPIYSNRTLGEIDSECRCQANHITSTNSMTTVSEPCDGCITQYFFTNGQCLNCPNNSESESRQTNCRCSGSYVTKDGNRETSNAADSCSKCQNGKYESNGMCVSCPLRSRRVFSDSNDICTCVSGYTRKPNGPADSDCLVTVSFKKFSSLQEGSADNGAMITLELSAQSYDFTVMISVQVLGGNISPSQGSYHFPQNETVGTLTVHGGNSIALDPDLNITLTIVEGGMYIGNDTYTTTIKDDDAVVIGFTESSATFNESDSSHTFYLQTNKPIAQNVTLMITTNSSSVMAEPSMVTIISNISSRTLTPVTLLILDDSTGGQADKVVMVSLSLVSPMSFSHLIQLSVSADGLSPTISIIIKDDDSPPTTTPFSLPVIIGVAAGGGAILAIFCVIIIIICICCCRFNISQQGFYPTFEDKANHPPSMIRYSASLRSISSQTVVPSLDGKGPMPEKENEFYV